MDERLARMEELLHQLIGLVGKTNSGMVELESRLHERIDGLEQRLEGRITTLEQKLEHVVEGIQRDVTVLKSESDHFARKLGMLERDLTVLRDQS